MANIEPHIEVYDVEKVSQVAYGQAGKIALIGAFPTATFKLDVFTDLDDAKDSLKGAYRLPNDNSVENSAKDPVPATYTAFYCLDYIFNSTRQSAGAESVLIVNTNYGAGSLVQASTNQMIADACTLLKEEDFDILTIAEGVGLTAVVSSETVLNPIWATLKAFVDEQYQAQKPFGIVTGVDMTSATSTIVGNFKTLFADKGIYKAVSTKVQINGDAEPLNIAQSGCWHSAFTSGRPVNRSETAKQYEGIIGQNTKDVYPLSATVTYKNLLDTGFHTTRYRNRRTQAIECLSNVTPVGWDMKIERVKNYIVKRLTLADILGEDNNRITRDYLVGVFEREKQLAINNNYLVDMDYAISNIDTTTVKADVVLYIADIVRVVKLNVQVEISAYEGE